MFRFHGDAIGAAGRITAPYDDVIPAQATAALPELGGVARAHAGRFEHRGIFRFEEARAELVGRRDGDVYETLIMAAVEGLNINEMVTADRIVARLVSSRRPDNPEPSITPIGSHFENLRIAGYRVRLDLATDTFHALSTYSSLARAYQDDTDNSRERLSRVGALAGREQASPRMMEYLPSSPFAEQIQSATTQSRPAPEIYSTTLVRRIRGIPSHGANVCGHVIEIAGFGVIRLAEFHISRHWKRLTMLRVNLGSPVRGEWMSAAAQGNGSDW
jgi:hypothetical protein